MSNFTDNLASSPNNSGIYGQPTQRSDQDVLGIVNQLKDREMHDFQTKANFMADLSLKQDRLRRLYDPTTVRSATKGELQGQQPDTQMQQGGQPPQQMMMGRDPNAMNDYQKGELGIRKQGLDLEHQKLAQQGKMGEEAIGIKTSQEKLNQQKSDQINAQKQADMERKTQEADSKIEIARQALESKNNNAEQALQAHKDMAAAMEERHKLELAQKDAQFKQKSEEHQKTIDALQEKIKQQGRTKTTTEVNPEGNKRTVTTEKGSAADTVKVKGKDGKTYEIPKDKLDEWNQNHIPDEQPQEEQ